MKLPAYYKPTTCMLFLFLAFTSWSRSSDANPLNGKFMVNEQIIAYDDHFTTYSGANGFIYVISNDIDYENDIDTASLTIVSPTSHGTVEVYEDGKVYYIPANGFVGTDSFTYSICDNDNSSTCDQATVTITVQGPSGWLNNPVIVNDDHVTTGLNTAISIEVLFNDMDPDEGIIVDSMKIVDAPVHGTAAINHMTGHIVYTPNQNYVGMDTFAYRACDVAVVDIDSGAIVTCGEGMVTVRVLSSGGLSVAEQMPDLFNVYLQGDLLLIESENDLQGVASVYSSNGQLVLRQAISKEIPFRAEPGVYFLTVETAHGNMSKKIIHL